MTKKFKDYVDKRLSKEEIIQIEKEADQEIKALVLSPLKWRKYQEEIPHEAASILVYLYDKDHGDHIDLGGFKSAVHLKDGKIVGLPCGYTPKDIVWWIGQGVLEATLPKDKHDKMA